MKQQFEMSEEQHAQLLKASQPVPLIALQCGMPRSPRDNAMRFWQKLGKELGFEWDSARPAPGMPNRFFTAEVTKEELDALEHDADVEMIGDDAFYELGEIGNK